MRLYFAPINLLGNHAYRHLLLRHGADMVVTELILHRDLFDSDGKRDKLAIVNGDEPRTIVQIGTGDPKTVSEMVDHIMGHHPDVPEINMNMGCPQSTLVKEVSCGGLLKDTAAMEEVASALACACREHRVRPSAKIRTGPQPHHFTLDDYVKTLKRAGITKIYVHGRTLGQGYHLPADHSPLASVIAEHPEVEFILNGDVDSHDAAKRVVEQTRCSEVMIGRAALHNPLIFRQIKDGITAKTSGFSPLENDPNLVVGTEGNVTCADEKRSIIGEFVEISTRNKLPVKTAKRNLMMLLKGISDVKPILKDLNDVTDYSGLSKSLHRHPFI